MGTGFRPNSLRFGAKELGPLVVCGHLHRSIQRRFGGTLAMTVPSTAHQTALDLRPGASAVWRLEPPGCALHMMLDGALLTHLVASGDHGPLGLYR